MKEIAEIVNSIVPVICPKSECGECDECDVLTKAILALISARETERVCKKCLKSYDAPALCPVCALKATDNAFDKGFETGKAEAKIEAEAREKAMIEALECAESIVNNSTDSRAAKCLAKIDSILKEAQHD